MSIYYIPHMKINEGVGSSRDISTWFIWGAAGGRWGGILRLVIEGIFTKPKVKFIAIHNGNTMEYIYIYSYANK